MSTNRAALMCWNNFPIIIFCSLIELNEPKRMKMLDSKHWPSLYFWMVEQAEIYKLTNSSILSMTNIKIFRGAADANRTEAMPEFVFLVFITICLHTLLQISRYRQ